MSKLHPIFADILARHMQIPGMNTENSKPNAQPEISNGNCHDMHANCRKYARTLRQHKKAFEWCRCCWVCGKVGGYGFTHALLLAGYDVPKGQIGYAHHNCMIRASKKAATQSAKASQHD